MADGMFQTPLSPEAQNYNGNEAFGLARAIPRPYCKGTLVFKADGAGSWVPQVSTAASLVLFQHGINDTNPGTNLGLTQSGIYGWYATRSVNLTSSQYNGGLSMKYYALILGIGMMQERIRRLTAGATTAVALSGSTPGYMAYAGGAVVDNDWQLNDRLFANGFGGSELYLLPVAQNTDCPLLLGIWQTFNSPRIGGEVGGPEVSQSSPNRMFRFRDDIMVAPGIQGNTAQPNQIQISWSNGPIGSVDQITGSAIAAATQYLGLDFIMTLDVAFGVPVPRGALLPTGQPAETFTFVFASEFDRLKYDCYQQAV